jgi:hypothetical protein
MEKLQKEMNIFLAYEEKHTHEDEYPI